MKTGNLFTACFMATFVKEKIYPKGNNLYIEMQMEGEFEKYPPFEQLRNIRGKRKGKAILKIQNRDYTQEHPDRKTEWKLAGRKGHVSKIYPGTPDKAWIDFKTLGRPDDIGVIYFDECLEYGKVKSMKICIAEGKRNDIGFIQMIKEPVFS